MRHFHNIIKNIYDIAKCFAVLYIEKEKCIAEVLNAFFQICESIIYGDGKNAKRIIFSWQ